MIALAASVWRECLRQRLPHVWLAVAAALLVLAPVAADLAIGARQRAVQDLGLFAVGVVDVALAIAVGVRAVGGALEDGTAWLQLARPIGRAEWVAGRALGALGTTGALAAGGVLAWLPTAVAWGLVTPDLLWWGAALWAQGALVAAWALLLSALARPTLAAACTALLCIAGALADEYVQLATEQGYGGVARALFAVLPDLDVFAVQEAIVHRSPVDLAGLAWAVGYAAASSGALVLLARAAVAARERA